MTNSKLPSEKWQLLQFKLYINYFNEKLKERSNQLFSLTRNNIFNIGKTTLNTDSNPYRKLYDEFEDLKQICLKREEEKLQINDEIEKNKLKEHHSIDVAIFGKTIAKDLSLFNDSNLDILWTSFLLHDIGRFPQLSMTHTFKDFDSFERKSALSSLNIGNQKVVDHGELGKIILQNGQLIKRFIPFTRIYDGFVGNVVGYHVKTDLPINLSSKIDGNDKVFNDYSLRELINNKKTNEIDKMTGWLIRILQDVDRLDILKQVERGDFVPKLSNEAKIEDYPYQLFYNGQFLNMHELKSAGLWNCNVGQLMRWSFIYQTNLVSVIKEIKNTGLISKVWEKNKINSLKNGYYFINELMDALIETSPDGIYVDKQKALLKVKS